MHPWWLVLALLVGAGTAWGAQSSGADLLSQTLAHEEQLPSFATLITNTLGADASAVVQCRYWRRRGADGAAQVRVALLPGAERPGVDPAAATKVFIFSGGQCTFTFRGRSIAVDPALVPTYGIADFIIPPGPGQAFTVAGSSVQGMSCLHLTQTIPADPATQAAAIVLDYDIDQASGLIVQVVRHDGTALSYGVVRSQLQLGAQATTDGLFAPAPQLRPGLISDVAALTAALGHGIP